MAPEPQSGLFRTQIYDYAFNKYLRLKAYEAQMEVSEEVNDL